VAAPTDLKYAIPGLESHSAEQSSASAIFCPTCIKNQHLYTACLAQYHIETDPGHPQYKELERKYYKYRRNLEKQYPQVCEDCEPRVLDRMREAGKTAKTDYLRRLLNQSRAKRAAARSTRITLSGLLNLGGKCLWYFGLGTQLLWHVAGLTAIALHNSPTLFDTYIPSTVLMVVAWLSSHAFVLSSWGFRSSLASLWWNPKFKQLNNGFMNHIKGFGEWYKYQATLLLVRSLYYYMMRSTILADPLAPATLGAHMFGLGFVTYVSRLSYLRCVTDRLKLAIAANYSLKVDMTRLWDSAPEKLPHVGPRTSPSPSPARGGDSMADALDQILVTPSRPGKATPPSLSYGNQQHIANNRYGDLVSHAQLIIISLGDYQPRSSQTATPPDEDQDMMDWTPAKSQSQHRAFNSVQPIEGSTRLFGGAPVQAKPGAMWFRLPAAPIAPAHRLRNPPNQPRLRVASQEVKENFFNNITHRTHDSELPVDAQRSAGERHDIEFAPQKFFPPPPPGESGERLAELLTSFSLSSDPEVPQETPSGHRLRHFCQAFALLLGLVFWNQVLPGPSEHTRNVTLTVMGACALMGARTVLDNIQTSPRGFAQTAGVVVGAAEVAAAGYGLQEILAGRGGCENCAPFGSLLICAMVMYEVLHI
jgi:hypothetical protein